MNNVTWTVPEQEPWLDFGNPGLVDDKRNNSTSKESKVRSTLGVVGLKGGVE
jgi:hypothetical protein